jgi:hypothetical protein
MRPSRPLSMHRSWFVGRYAAIRTDISAMIAARISGGVMQILPG